MQKKKKRAGGGTGRQKGEKHKRKIFRPICHAGGKKKKEDPLGPLASKERGRKSRRGRGDLTQKGGKDTGVEKTYYHR